MSSSSLLIAGYLCLGIVAAWITYRKRGDVYYLPVLLCVGLTIALNATALVFYAITGDDEVFAGLAINDVLTGLRINLVYSTMWVVGYLGASKAALAKPSVAAKKPDRGLPTVFALMLVCLAAYVWTLFQDFGYAYAQRLYMQGGESAADVGPVLTLSVLVAPVAAAILIHVADARIVRLWGITFSGRRVRLTLWALLASTAVLGIATSMQRGKFFQVVVLGTFVLVATGRKRLALGATAAAVLVGLIASPIIVSLRTSERAGDDVTVTQAANQSYQSGIHLDDVAEQAARNAMLPITGGALVQFTREHGEVGFATYPSILTDQVPRILDPGKPYPLSYDGTAAGRPAFIVGIVLGRPESSGWDAGGATMYWQFGWLGVVIGGLLVGGYWSFLAHIGFRAGGVIATAFVFAMMVWGTLLFESPDYLADRTLAILRIFVLVWIAVRVLTARSKTRAAGRQCNELG